MKNFIGEYYIDSGLCQQLIYLFESNPESQYAGKVNTYISTGSIDEDSEDLERKKSTDLECHDFQNIPIVTAYHEELQKCLEQYFVEYPDAKSLPPFTSTWLRIQRYDRTGHFKQWHFERSGGYTRKRCLVYMTYLNDVESGGQTEYKYQEKNYVPVAGKTLIWPADWTHTHRGFGPSCDGYKYVATGWYVHE